MTRCTQQLKSLWQTRVALSIAPKSHQNSIFRWLWEQEAKSIHEIPESDLTTVTERLEYRYHVLRQRYLNVQSRQGYRRLIQRLGMVILQHPAIARTIEEHPYYKKSLLSLIPQILQTMMQKDPEVQQIIAWIGQCTSDTHLREALVLASLEDYCCQCINHQPLLVERLLNTFCDRNVHLSLSV